MEPEHLRFGGGATETLLHPLVALWMLIAIILILTISRHRAIIPFLGAALTIPSGQVVLIGGLHFTVMRILVVAGLARMCIFAVTSSKRKFWTGGFNALDWAVVLWTVSAFVVICLQWMNAQALIKNLGDFLDALGAYVVFRFLIPDRRAIERTVKVLIAISVIQGVVMVGEQITHINPFGLLGGVSAGVETALRGGNFRSGGVLGPIISGVFSGMMIPMFFWLWAQGKSRIAACAGLAGATAMAITSNSSTSYMACGASLFALAFWPLRGRMRLVRWGLGLALVALHLVMKAPVWALIQRTDLTGSSSSYHRYALVDNTIRHFSEWWLLGTKTYNDWGWDMWDICDQFVYVAVTGGLITLILFCAIYPRSFAAIGNARKRARGDRRREWFLWCLGSSLFAGIVASFGMNFVVQVLMFWFPVLAFISVAASEVGPATVRMAAVVAQEEFASALGAAGTSAPLNQAK